MDNFKTINSKEELEKELEANRFVFLDFYAQWCGPCRIMLPIIEELSQELKEVAFLKIDVDQNSQLALEYAVKSIPAMFFIENKEKLEAFIGSTDKETIKNKILSHVNN
jgi:thioredoxin 1